MKDLFCSGDYINISIDSKSELMNLEEQILTYDFDGAQKTLKPLIERLDV